MRFKKPQKRKRFWLRRWRLFGGSGTAIERAFETADGFYFYAPLEHEQQADPVLFSDTEGTVPCQNYWDTVRSFRCPISGQLAETNIDMVWVHDEFGPKVWSPSNPAYVDTGTTQAGNTTLFADSNQKFTAIFCGNTQSWGLTKAAGREGQFDVGGRLGDNLFYQIRGAELWNIIRGSDPWTGPSYFHSVRWNGETATRDYVGWGESLRNDPAAVGTGSEETSQRIIIGASNNGAGNPQSGLVVRAMIVFDRDLSDSELTDVIAHIQDIYGV